MFTNEKVLAMFDDYLKRNLYRESTGDMLSFKDF